MSDAADNTISTILSRGPAALLGGPEEVLHNPRLSLADKREVLARWASDTHAVENAPALRQLDDGSVVQVDEILCALKALDGQEGRAPAERPVWIAHTRKRGRFPHRPRIIRTHRREDEDPPPRPAAAAFPVRIKLTDAVAA
ncbi:MAG: hypothetical protein JWQ36_1620 [Enterovirga sp.]|jgi:hypothetical protein|nr:hypothetical protein [Enterovirga sp.]